MTSDAPDGQALRRGDYDPSIYLGAAAHYRKGRPPYSPQLEAVLADGLALDGTGKLLDVGCGPGTLTVRLAHLFDAATGLDPDAEMLAEGRRAAEQQKLDRLTWVDARAEDLPCAAPGPFRLVIFGQSIWWTDELPVVEAVYDMLDPGGALVAVAHIVEGRPVPPSPGHPRIPHAEIEALVRSYLGPVKRAGQGVAARRAHRIDDVIARTRFGSPHIVFAPGDPAVVRDIEGVVSGYLSMSFAAPHLFGSQLDAFVAEVRGLLSARSGDGLFWDWPGDTEIVFAIKGRHLGPR